MSLLLTNWSYLLGSKVVVYTDHAAIKFLMTKKDANPRSIRLILLLQEFNIEVIDKKGTASSVADHLSHLPMNDSQSLGPPINDLPMYAPWIADFANFHAS